FANAVWQKFWQLNETIPSSPRDAANRLPREAWLPTIVMPWTRALRFWASQRAPPPTPQPASRTWSPGGDLRDVRQNAIHIVERLTMGSGPLVPVAEMDGRVSGRHPENAVVELCLVVVADDVGTEEG